MNGTDFSDINDGLMDRDSGVAKQIRQCKLKRPVKIDREFGLPWRGLTSDRPHETVRLDKDLGDMADGGLKN